jgi:hypothetical protein
LLYHLMAVQGRTFNGLTFKDLIVVLQQTL